MTSISDQLGAKLGPRLAELMARAVVTTTQRVAPAKVAQGMQLQERFFTLVAGEAAGTVSHFSRQLAADPNAPLWLRKTFEFMANGSGQWAALLNFSVYGSGLSTSVGGMIGNILAPVIQAQFRDDPNAALPASAAAALVAARLRTFEQGAHEAGASAINRARFTDMVNLAENLPDIGTLLEMYRRGYINEPTAEGALRKAGFREQFINQISRLRQVLLTPEQLADMVDRGEITPNLAESKAQQAGLSHEDFDRLTKIVGQPPAPQDLLAGFRRGLIDAARLRRGIRQSPIRSEWIPFIEDLQWEPLSTLQAADAVLQGHMSRAEGRKIARQNGTKADDFDVLVESAGRPPGIDVILELWNRGLASESEVKQALLESPLKNKWVPLIMQTRRRIPPQEQVRMMVKQGVISARQGVEKLLDLGYSREDSDAFVRLARADKTETERDLTKSEVLNLYQVSAIQAPAAKSMLSDLGYDDEETALLILLSDMTRQKRDRDAAVSVIRSKYVAHKITEQETSTTLDALKVPSGMRDHLLTLWDLERDANVAHLTPTQVLSAMKKGLIDESDALNRLLRHGYGRGDALLLIALAGGKAGG